MEQLTDRVQEQAMSRRLFLKQATTITGVSAGAVLLAACGSSGATATAVPPAAQQPTGTPSAMATNSPTATSEAMMEATTQTSVTQSATGQSATPNIVAAANAFLATLSQTEKSTGLFAWTDSAQKQRWSNFPPAGFKRAGLMWTNLSEAQQNAWSALMQTTLSTEGYKRVLAEWNADDALLAQEGTGGGFGKGNYYIALIGTPSESDAWQWQFGGHHVTVNATVVGTNLSLTPSFIGVQPGQYTDSSGATVRPLGDIEDEGFALVNSLDATQQKAAILGSTPIDLVLGPGQDGKTIQSEGLLASQMNAKQQSAFLKLIGHYTGLANDAAAAARMDEIKSMLAQTYFAWYGPTTAGKAAYFRVTGPTVVIEFSPQGGGGPGSNEAATDMHIHGIYRDPTNDYGAKYTGIEITS